MAQTREPGYYWVKINVGWRIMQWHPLACWYHIGGMATFQDDDMQEINEHRIIAPDEMIENEIDKESRRVYFGTDRSAEVEQFKRGVNWILNRPTKEI